MKVETALDFYKTQQLLATALGISQAAVSKWGDIMPEKQALKIERITNGELKYDPELYAAPDKTGQEKAEAA
jgi:DNA-binding transcriptional regulator YdaS (Cro superfamily)